jgi:ribonuclease VapC
LIVLVIDTSAVIAVAFKEPDMLVMAKRLGDTIEPIMLPASCYLEAVIVLRSAAMEREWLDAFIGKWRITIAPITETVTRRAADAFERFGRGSGHPARLNFGDCLSYAVAVELDAALLFKGADFAHTDVKRAL